MYFFNKLRLLIRDIDGLRCSVHISFEMQHAIVKKESIELKNVNFMKFAFNAAFCLKYFFFEI